jgi:hypothetical protein
MNTTGQVSGIISNLVTVDVNGPVGQNEICLITLGEIKMMAEVIKVIGNKDIKSVTNLTKMNSWVAITIKVDVNYAIRDAEEIINKTLPQIAAKHPEIISGPYYKGILSVEMGFAVLSIIAECNEDNYHKVERFLVREILLALRENNVPVR